MGKRSQKHLSCSIPVCCSMSRGIDQIKHLTYTCCHQMIGGLAYSHFRQLLDTRTHLDGPDFTQEVPHQRCSTLAHMQMELIKPSIRWQQVLNKWKMKQRSPNSMPSIHCKTWKWTSSFVCSACSHELVLKDLQKINRLHKFQSHMKWQTTQDTLKPINQPLHWFVRQIYHTPLSHLVMPTVC